MHPAVGHDKVMLFSIPPIILFLYSPVLPIILFERCIYYSFYLAYYSQSLMVETTKIPSDLGYILHDAYVM